MNKNNLEGLRKFVAPEFVFGSNSRLIAGQYLKNFGVKKTLVVTDEGVISAGWTSEIIDSIKEEGIDYVVFSGVTANPKDHEVMEGSKLFRDEGCTGIVAIGGGSPMDCAKGISIVSSNGGNILDYEGVDEVPNPGPPLICVPTTAGSSADLSQFAIITDSSRKVKIAIISKSTIPDVALVDPDTTVSMDSDLTAATGLDAITHAVEAYVSNASSPITDLHALEAIRIVKENLINAINRPSDLNARRMMMMGSLYAGLAFSNASLGAVHAMAHSLGGLMDSPHGEVNAILLPYVIEYNFDYATERYLRIAGLMDVSTGRVTDIAASFTGLKERAGDRKRLSDLGIKKSDIPALAANAMNDACMVTNPRIPKLQEIKEIYEKAL